MISGPGVLPGPPFREGLRSVGQRRFELEGVRSVGAQRFELEGLRSVGAHPSCRNSVSSKHYDVCAPFRNPSSA